MEVLAPAACGLVDLFNHHIQGHRRAPPIRELLGTVFEPLNGPPGRLDVRIVFATFTTFSYLTTKPAKIERFSSGIHRLRLGFVET